MSEPREDRVTLDVIDGIAYATLNRADKLNALDMPMLQALASVPGRIAEDRTIRAVILQGDGTAFCSGLDFASIGKDQVAQVRGFAKLPVQTTNLYQKACWAWRELPVPVIAVLRGFCFGGGLQLALAADFRISTPDCELSVMEGKWGLIPDMTGSVTLRELVPIDVAKRLTMTAEVFDGTRAKELGLVTEVSSDPLAAAKALAAQICTRSPDSVALTKRLFHDTWTSSPRSAFWTESQLQLRLILGKNHKIARAAGKAKEIPKWVTRSLS
ncbi:crotonase/enoyl-CoA hydratase family protein [Antrihabitans cavernicola]|uniref:Crotonase/enoyl-CoA hydratase family protein n=1 Tax=Antrihabitans cavernicola TaxID=2495913 RepID=A0A5A7S7C7_9NOCA|nr:crotonase/enoyl-CoA hydratase family protein [Spelaeibacter cavernicola]KAA0021079.1 crotonase/enoyl-CoA hydratase family protein [Spelaeibacter cavernicola]